MLDEPYIQILKMVFVFSFLMVDGYFIETNMLCVLEANNVPEQANTF